MAIMEPASDSSAVSTPPKFSRYQSVRHAAAKQQAEVSVSSPPALPNALEDDSVATKPQSDTIARSMSRYRRAKSATTKSTPVPSTPATVPALPLISPPAGYELPQRTPEVAEPTSVQPYMSHKGNIPQSRQVMEEEGEHELSHQEKERTRKEAMERLTISEWEQRAARATDRAQAQDHAQNRLEKRHEERHTSQRIADHKRQSWKGKIGLSRHKEGHLTHDNAKKDASTTNNIEPGGGGIVPGIDAPVSAVNAGERRVLVKCSASTINLPVTPTTRAKDIIFSAMNCMSEHIDPRKSILLESFSQLGLERPLRRYEHVRDVMNSWVTDTQNVLIISPSPFDGATDKLEVQSAPREQPKDATFYLYHSPKPGKWDKRFVILRSDGQVVVSKKDDGKEATNICHLSDFDIYSPTPRQFKKLKPPKKLCFAVKSQQKSSMFLSTENFVHFFATNDTDLAQNWYDAVHSWRSWYLVSVLGAGQKTKDIPQPSHVAVGNQSTSAPHHQRVVSTETMPYQLGSFKPLLDFSSVEPPSKPVGEATISSSREMYLRRKQAREHAPPPPAFQALGVDTHAGPVDSPSEDDDSAFSPTGLLGRTYTQRRDFQREREARLVRDNASEEPLFSHGLLKNLSPNSSMPSSQNPFSNPSSRQNSRSNTMHSTHAPDMGARSRSNSARKPLVDLTPVYREPPQHSRKGHGVKVDPGVPLVEAATGPELVAGAIAIPPATSWKRPEPQIRLVPSNEPSSASNVPRRTHTIRSQHHVHDSIPPTSPNNSFTPSSLLALSAQTPMPYTATGTGHGVATGDRHTGRPLLDLALQSEFAEGSLLRRMERES